MHYVLIDDSIPFDGYTPTHRPLGGAEKAFVSLASALAKRRHTVTVVNRTPFPMTAEGVRYVPFGELGQRPVEADVAIAFRQPGLLGAVRKAKHRLLWVVAAPDYLDAEVNAPLWQSFDPTILFISAVQQKAYRGALPHRLLIPGVRDAFRKPMSDVDDGATQGFFGLPTQNTQKVPPHAVVTTHPLHGLVWLTEIWRRLIHPQMPEARLAVYSSVLAKGLREEPIPEALEPVLAHIKAVSEANIVVTDPRGDLGMAEAYSASRIHFYPGQAQDYACWTLAESQAAGTPAIARNAGGVEERVINGQSGFLVPDAAAFANVALQILGNDDVHRSLSDTAADISRWRPWDLVAEELDTIVAGLPVTA